jgi:hypothetical protein
VSYRAALDLLCRAHQEAAEFEDFAHGRAEKARPECVSDEHREMVHPCSNQYVYLDRYSAGMNSAMVHAGTKYFARSRILLFGSSGLVRTMIFRLMMPRRHLRFASKTPDPEFPVVATSLMTVENRDL